MKMLNCSLLVLTLYIKGHCHRCLQQAGSRNEDKVPKARGHVRTAAAPPSFNCSHHNSYLHLKNRIVELAVFAMCIQKRSSWSFFLA